MLNETLTNYEKITANVINRSPRYMADMLVVGSWHERWCRSKYVWLCPKKGLIGRVIEVNAASSKNRIVDFWKIKIQIISLFESEGKTAKLLGILSSYDQKEKSFGY